MSKYTDPPQAPPVFMGTKESIVADMQAMCDSTRKLLDRLVADIPADKEAATFETVLRPQIRNENDTWLGARILGFYQFVSADSALRDASTEATKIIDEFEIECSMREDVFRLVEAVYQNCGLQNSKDADNDRVIDDDLAKKCGLEDAESARLLEKERKGYIRNGLGLPAGPKRDRFKEIKTRLSQIQIEFTKNLNEENGGVWFTKDELDGVPADVVDNLEKGEGEHEGKVKLSFKYPDLTPALKFAKDPDVRKKILIQNENKLANQNGPLMKEALLLRDEAARLLGYVDHASFLIEEKMAKTTGRVMDFLGDLKVRLASGGVKEIDHLLAIKKEDLAARNQEFDGNYYLWDHRFYGRLMIEKEFSVDETAIAEYFPLRPTVGAMLRIFEQLVGLVFMELSTEDRKRISPTGKAEDIVWHEDVIMFSVWDDASEGDGFVGYLYLDLHPRPGKYGHAANFNLQPGFVMPDGKRRYPATSLVCNFSKATPTKPSLLKHDEVVTLFHELGHALHDLVSRTRYARFHGTSVVRDFVEAPSQMLENWCWTPDQLKSLSGHYQTKEPIPDEMIAKLVATKNANRALMLLRQLHLGLFDMKIHTPKSHEELESLDVAKVYNEMRAEIVGIKGPESLGESSDWGYGHTTFGHLLAGYDAGYYGYLFSQVYSTDMFWSQFKEDPTNGERGRRYRHLVLEKGGSQDEMSLLEKFLGRKPSSEAFYKDLDLA